MPIASSNWRLVSAKFKQEDVNAKSVNIWVTLIFKHKITGEEIKRKTFWSPTLPIK